MQRVIAEVSYQIPFNKELYAQGIPIMKGAELLKAGKAGRGKAESQKIACGRR